MNRALLWLEVHLKFKILFIYYIHCTKVLRAEKVQREVTVYSYIEHRQELGT